MEDKIIKILNASGLNWWLDSGSLLGLIREGHFFEYDDDIDIGILNNEDADKTISCICNLGFRCIRFSWKGWIYKYKLIPQTGFRYKLDINLYIAEEDFCRSPQLVKKRPKSLSDKITLMKINYMKAAEIKKGKTCKSLINYGIWKLYKIGSRENASLITGENYVPRLYELYEWRIPMSFLEEMVCHKSGYRIFSKTEEYLAYRYGDWRIEKKNWKFTEDDGGLVKAEIIINTK